MDSFPQAIEEHLAIIEGLESQHSLVKKAGEVILETLQSGRKIILCGNGGSAADCQHIAAELMVRYKKTRKAMPAIALTSNTSILTAHTNDFEFETLFSRQIEALGNTGDCLIAISTSGNSKNILAAAESAQLKGINVIGLMGGHGGELVTKVDYPVIVPSYVTARIQEIHILIAHWWCELAESL